MTKEEFFGKFKSLHLWGNLAAMFLVLVLFFFGIKWWLNDYTHHGENIEVPDLISKTENEAKDLLNAKGLQIQVIGESYNRELPAGCIIVQDPKAGSNVKEGRIIYVTLNSLTAPKVRIPDVIEYKSYRGAQADLLSLEFELTEPQIVPGQRDLVMKIYCNGREVHNGEEVAKYSVLTLAIGDGSVGGSSSTEDLEELPEEYLEGDQDETPQEEYDMDVLPDMFE